MLPKVFGALTASAKLLMGARGQRRGVGGFPQ